MPGETMLGKKPYDFVPLSATVQREAPRPHDHPSPKRGSGRITLELETLTPVHVFQGQYRPADGGRDLIACHARRGEVPVIPGSSLKGVVRSIAEAVSYSCAPQLPAKALQAALPGTNNRRCSGEDGLCITCRIFGFSAGARSYRGQVSFGEFRPAAPGAARLEVVNLPPLYSPFRSYPNNNPPLGRDCGNERLYYCAICSPAARDCYQCHKQDYLRLRDAAGTNRRFHFRGRKFYFHSRRVERGDRPYECLAAGSRLRGEVIFHDLQPPELALLAFALGLDGSFALKVGYGKPAYLGSMRVHLIGVDWLQGRYGQELPRVPELPALARQYAEVMPADLQEKIAALRRILDWENPRGPEWQVIQGNRVY